MSLAIVQQDRPDSGAGRTEADILGDFFLGVMHAAQSARQELLDNAGSTPHRGSRIQAMAVVAGLEPKQYYTVAEVSKFSGQPISTIYKAIQDEDVKAVTPAGSSRGYRISAEECERWFASLERRS